MTYTVKFTDYQMDDDGDSLTVEGVYRKYGAFAGVHSFEFADRLNSFDPAHWTAPAGITVGDTLSVDVVDGAADRAVWYDGDMPHSYTVEFTFHNFWTVFLRGDGADTYYRVAFVDLFIIVQRYENGVVTHTSKKFTASECYGAFGRIKIAVLDAQFTSDSQGRNIVIAIWLNDRLMHSYAEDVETSNPPLRMAFVVPAGVPTGVLYSDLRVPDLGEVLQWSSLSPGENPISAIQTAIEDRYIKAWLRWDGTLRAWSPAARLRYQTIAKSREFGLTPVSDKRQIISDLRVLGAFQFVRLIDNDLIRDYGNRFREISNTSLWNADDCLRIGRQIMVRAKEQAFQAQVDTRGLIYAEVEDRLGLPDHQNEGESLDYIIDSASLDVKPNRIAATVHARRYYYGEP